MILAQTRIQWFIKSNFSADGPSINNMITDSDSPHLYFYVVKAGFKNCIFFPRLIYVYFVFLSFDNCSFYGCVVMDASNYLFGSSYNITHVFLVRCTIDISDWYTSFYITLTVESQMHIVQSRLIGNEFNLRIQETSAVQPVAHLTIHDSIINDTSIKMMTDDNTAVGIVQITNTILTHTVVTSEEDKYSAFYEFKSVQTAFFIDNCTFIQSSLHCPSSIIVYIVNSRFDVKCQAKGCALKLTGLNHVDMDISHINALCKLLKIKMCYGIYLSNIDFIGIESKTQLIITEGIQMIIQSCTFSVSNSVPKLVAQNLIFEDHSNKIHLINVKVNVTEMRSVSDIPLFSIDTAELISQSVLLFCPKSFKVIEKISGKDNNSQFLCQKDVCQNDEYSLMGQSKLNNIASVHNRKKHALIQLIPSCFPCPVGASCEQERVVALPNYWGKRKDHVISMFRCPQDYCCQSNGSCSDIDSCNGLRTGILCGHCGPNMTESLFSTDCVDSKTCKPGVIINLYILAVALYSLGLLSFDIVKDKFLTCFSKFCKKFKNKIFKKGHHPAAENIEKISQENREKESQTKEDSMKYLQILFYYVQDASLFKVHLPEFEASDDSILIQIFQWSPDIIAKMYLGISNMCFPLTTAITKILFKCLFGPCVILFLFLIYISQNIMGRLCKGQSRFLHFVRLSLLKVFILSVLFSYQQMLIGAFSLVQCVRIDELKVLYVQGDIHCDQIWQKVIEVYICVNILPLFFVISNASYDVRDMKMSVRTFILTCLFPLPVIIVYYLGSRIKKIYKPSNINAVDNSVMLEETYLESVNHMSLKIEAESELCISEPDSALEFEDSDTDIASEYSTDLVNVRQYKSQEYDTENGYKITDHDDDSAEGNLQSSRKEVTKTLVDHYKILNIFGFKFTWLAAHKLYRLILVASNTYVTEPLLRLIIMTSLLVFMTICNVCVQPYKKRTANIVATVSYLCNIVIAMINMCLSMLEKFSCRTNCPLMMSVVQWFNKCEQILVIYLPLGAVVLWFVISKLIKCKRKDKIV